MADLIFNPLTDKTVWFANAAAFNNWVSNIQVNWAEADLSAATTEVRGLVKMAEGLAYEYTVPNYVGAYYTFTATIDGAPTEIQVPSRAAFEMAVENITEIKIILDELRAKLINAGILSL